MAVIISAKVLCILHDFSNVLLTIVRGTIPHAMFGRKNYGAISGVMAGPLQLAKAAGLLVVAAILRADPESFIFLIVLLAMSAVSLGFYWGG